MVFDTTAFIELLEEERSQGMYFHADLIDVRYARGNPADWRPHGFESLITDSEKVIESMLMEKDADVDNAVLQFLVGASTLKHEAFGEEREVRLVAIAGTQAAKDRMIGVPDFVQLPLKIPFFTNRGLSQRQQISLLGATFPRLPLQRVIVGPSPMQEEHAKAARALVGRGVEVQLSRTPLVA